MKDIDYRDINSDFSDDMLKQIDQGNGEKKKKKSKSKKKQKNSVLLGGGQT